MTEPARDDRDMPPQLREALNIMSRRGPVVELTRPGTALFETARPDDAGGMEDTQQSSGAPCTCTGGPYVHGPEGLRQALRKLAERAESGQQTKGGNDHE